MYASHDGTVEEQLRVGLCMNTGDSVRGRKTICDDMHTACNW
jgi:hypothetical protein